MIRFMIFVDGKDMRHGVYSESEKEAIERYCRSEYIDPKRVTVKRW